MITLLDKQKIILKHYHDGKSQRAIQRETGISRKTIRKYIKEYEVTKAKLLVEGETGSKEELIQSIVLGSVLPESPFGCVRSFKVH